LHKEKNGKNKGFAFIQYKNSKDAKLAIQKMNGFKIAKRAIKVQPISYNMEHLVGKGGSGAELDDNNMTLYS
jgi:RNA recognition motif-containing protein